MWETDKKPNSMLEESKIELVVRAVQNSLPISVEQTTFLDVPAP